MLYYTQWLCYPYMFSNKNDLSWTEMTCHFCVQTWSYFVLDHKHDFFKKNDCWEATSVDVENLELTISAHCYITLICYTQKWLVLNKNDMSFLLANMELQFFYHNFVFQNNYCLLGGHICWCCKSGLNHWCTLLHLLYILYSFTHKNDFTFTEMTCHFCS